MGRIGIIGASRLGHLIAHHALTTGLHEVAGYFDNAMAPGTVVPGGVVLGGTTEVRARCEAGEIEGVYVGVGYANFPWRRQFCIEFADLLMPALVHPNALVDSSAKLGKGSVILPGAIIDAEVTLDSNVLVNVGAVIAHHTQIEASTFIAPAAAIAGHVLVGECCFVGLGARIVNDITITAGCRIGAGAVVTQSLHEPGVYVGVPARLRPPTHTDHS